MIIRSFLLLWTFYNILDATVSRNLVTTKEDISKFTIQMIGYSPQQNDDYVAVSREATPGYIVGFEPMAHADRVHHMLLYGCGSPAGDGFWRGGQTCGGGGSYILYAWARNAPNLVLPKDVAFSVGHENDGIKYFVLQIHYAHPFAGTVQDFSGVTLHVSQTPPKSLAAVMLFVSGEPIPPHKPQHQTNMSCFYDGQSAIHPFAFRTHTHGMGRVVSAYFKHDEHWTKIGKRNPQWPQLFESIPTSLSIHKGDFMAATCRFDSHDKDEPTPMGSMGTNEMCNFYMMFYWDANDENPFPYGAICSGRQGNAQDYPVEGTQLLPSHPELEHHAHQSSIPFGVVEELALNKIGDVTLGQVSGLSFDREGNLIVFHRANKPWDQRTFDQYNFLLDKSPIKDDVILFVKFDGNQSTVLKKMGANKFYVPHGIHMDRDGFLYTTDVGSHTVAKWKITGNDMEKVWENGKPLEPSSLRDREHFCKPAGVIRNGDKIYVADGYCNSRIVELDLNGKRTVCFAYRVKGERLGTTKSRIWTYNEPYPNESSFAINTHKRTNEFGLPGNGPAQFQLPHDLAVTTTGNLMVADRENGRVQELTTKGEFVREWSASLFSNLYSADVYRDNVFMVPGRVDDSSRGISVYVGRAGLGLVEYAFAPVSRPFGAPHVVRVCPSGNHIFVGDISTDKATLWKFKIQHEGGKDHAQGSTASLGSTMLMDSGSVPTGGSTGVIILLAGIIVVLAIGLKKRFMTPVNGVSVFDRASFKPLSTEETVGFISDTDSE